MFIFIEVEASEAGFGIAVFFPFKGSKGWRVYSAYTMGEFGVPEIHGGWLRDFSEGWVFRRLCRARSSVCARKACAIVDGISRKQQQLRACCGRVCVNGRARKHAFVRLDLAPEHQRACAGWAGGGLEIA
jgi:hypothetical protein